MTVSNTKTIVLITGANTGLGFEIAKALFARPLAFHILIGCRGDLARADDAIARLKGFSPDSTSTAEPLSIDITSDESIALAFKQVEQRHGHVDVLVNNAGADLTTLSQLSIREGWNQTYDVNVTGTQLFTSAFASLLLASKASPPRLLFITSGLASVGERAAGLSPKYMKAPPHWPKPQTPWFSYLVSKTALNMLATEWARLLRADGVAVFNVSPGFLNTGLGNNRATGQEVNKAAMGALDPAIGANFCADVIQGKRDMQAWPTQTIRKDDIQPW
ncbi:NAD(P)-binding domain protein [Metarhizium rileyi]|uniref:NAD(P)-binding domain protein n=1 Tax=Metarhizium rileyi (strain RCEF 4871) TaxID=1649241 RepID=A0A166YFZ7_METRR|nr:NAD(P)-binding domain protein [Metarhizium rileyi RCEF 4871]